jgi:hypothetical protein
MHSSWVLPTRYTAFDFARRRDFVRSAYQAGQICSLPIAARRGPHVFSADLFRIVK